MKSIMRTKLLLGDMTGHDDSSHESDEDDGIPVITIPLGDILRKYARMVEGDHSEYESDESDERFVIREYKKKDKAQFLEF